MKTPLMLPSYMCGECGIQMLPDRRSPEERVGGPNGPTVIATCHTPRCPQQDVPFEILLHPALVPNPPAEGNVAA
jgi:hypothetical protein